MGGDYIPVIASAREPSITLVMKRLVICNNIRSTPIAQKIWNFKGFHAIYHVIVPAFDENIKNIVVETSDRQYKKETSEPANMLSEINGIVIFPKVFILEAPKLKEASSKTGSTCCKPAYADRTVNGIFLIV